MCGVLGASQRKRIAAHLVELGAARARQQALSNHLFLSVPSPSMVDTRFIDRSQEADYSGIASLLPSTQLWALN